MGFGSPSLGENTEEVQEEAQNACYSLQHRKGRQGCHLVASVDVLAD
jgi:hypothetical protein